MLFNSIEFAIFLPIVFALYWIIGSKQRKLQNGLLLVASYVFYGWWDWRFLSLIFLSSLADFFIGNLIFKSGKPDIRKALLAASIAINLGFLIFFKYFNFFSESFSEAFLLFGSNIEVSRLNIILPVGISFYTFQTLSYSIDIYREKLKPASSPVSFFAFVSFFPQLVAGPIERASNLLPQFQNDRRFNYNSSVDGLKQILWGLFKKMVIADNCAETVNYIFNNSADLSGSTLLIGALFFTFQIYGDFSGYSDIAIGTARLFGFNLMQNFAFPYFSRDIAEFWRRWHISLSTWFRDYLYIPLGGSRGGTGQKIRNVFIIFVVSGFWHGANWTFIVWGALHAIFFLPLIIFDFNRSNLNLVAENTLFPSFKEIFGMLSTFVLVMLAWVFFRANDFSHAVSILKTIFSSSLLDELQVGKTTTIITLGLILFLMVLEWFGRSGQYGIESIAKNWWKPFRYLFYYFLISLIFVFAGKEQEFIYFQF